MNQALLRSVIFLLLWTMFVSRTDTQSVVPRPAVPLEPIAAILDAFRSHQMVALGEPHGNEQGHVFRLALIRDSRFALTVNDVVVECGNARYQDLIDRFIRGENVPDQSLRQAWQNTVGSPGTACDLPIYEGFIRAVRALNVSLPRERQLRVLLGDPPIDWETVRSREDVVKWAAIRDSHAADVIQREVLSKQRRALVIYGDMHLRRKHMGANYMTEDPITKTPVDGRTITEQLEEKARIEVFTIWTGLLDAASDVSTLQANVASWPAPSLTLIRGTVFGTRDFSFYYPTSRDPARPMEDKFDALLYLGPPSTMTQARLSPTLCADPAYLEMRVGRMSLVGQPTDQLKAFCAAAAPR